MEIIDMGDVFLADFSEEQELSKILWPWPWPLPRPTNSCSSVYDSTIGSDNLNLHFLSNNRRIQPELTSVLHIVSNND